MDERYDRPLTVRKDREFAHTKTQFTQALEHRDVISVTGIAQESARLLKLSAAGISALTHCSGAIAQLGERIVRNDEVVGSIPTSSTIISLQFKAAACNCP